MFHIGNQIIKFRKNKGLSANALSKVLEVDPSTINKIENGKSNPSVDLIYKICDFFDITPAEFFNDSDVPLELTKEQAKLLSATKDLTPEKLTALSDLIKLLDDKK